MVQAPGPRAGPPRADVRRETEPRGAVKPGPTIRPRAGLFGSEPRAASRNPTVLAAQRVVLSVPPCNRAAVGDCPATLSTEKPHGRHPTHVRVMSWRNGLDGCRGSVGDLASRATGRKRPRYRCRHRPRPRQLPLCRHSLLSPAGDAGTMARGTGAAANPQRPQSCARSVRGRVRMPRPADPSQPAGPPALPARRPVREGPRPRGP